ncbi:hypothetical protein ANTQUA_LOCUS7784 [Anthophora quadrimaculata]
MGSIIRQLQEDYNYVIITGLFLVYPENYIHVLEASEDIIYRHFKALYSSENDSCKVGRSIFLPSFHHVHQRFFTEWHHVFTIPPTLIQKLESHKLEDIQMQMSICFNKIYELCDHISNTVHDYAVPIKEVIRNINDKISRLYPESTLLEYLLNANNPVIMTVEKYLEIFSAVPFISLYSEYLQYQKNVSFLWDKIWPPPRDMMFCVTSEKEDRPSVVSAKNRRGSRRPTR